MKFVTGKIDGEKIPGSASMAEALQRQQWETLVIW